jgi:hypothetical protein
MIYILKDFRILLLFVCMLIYSGCSTPHERRGVSPVPFNSEQPDSYNTFDGGF